jgi:hypothetical protein
MVHRWSAPFQTDPYVEKGDPKLKWGHLVGESQWLHPDERRLFVAAISRR